MFESSRPSQWSHPHWTSADRAAEPTRGPGAIFLITGFLPASVSTPSRVTSSLPGLIHQFELPQVSGIVFSPSLSTLLPQNHPDGQLHGALLSLNCRISSVKNQRTMFLVTSLHCSVIAWQWTDLFSTARVRMEGVGTASSF